MSQNITNTGMPTPTTTQDWTAIPDEAIQLASDNDKETANAECAKHQCQKWVRKECKVAEEAAECARVAQCQEMEACEAQEKVAWEKEEHAYAVDSETEFYAALSQQSKTLIGDRLGMSVPVLAESGDHRPAESSKAKGKVKAHDPVPVSLCTQCIRAGVECMFNLVKASNGWGAIDPIVVPMASLFFLMCLGLKEQCVLPGGPNSMPKKKWAPKEMMLPRASERKKHEQVNSPEVEVQARSLRSENVAGEILVAWGSQAIMAAIDWHRKMAKHQEISKETQHMQRHSNNHLFELQETEYWQVAEVGESSDEGSTSKETSDGETDKDMEGKEALGSDPEV
ncbi:hypothetical protein EDC04DRAFT_2603280 [Pisolithus marmoratus]|nr:hypothetical protein EDC04DRAFT_2603280 [Pisolithus marmoratus]